MLGRANAAVRRGAFGDALVALLDAWRATPAPELAELVARASARAARGRPPITGASRRALHAAWLEVAGARDPADVDRLLASAAHGSLAQAAERVAWLAALPRDPRVPAGLEALLAAPPAVAFARRGATAVWDAVARALAAHADPRTRTIHERLAWLAYDRAPSPFDAGTTRARTTRVIAAAALGIAPAPALPAPLRAACGELAAALS